MFLDFSSPSLCQHIKVCGNFNLKIDFQGIPKCIQKDIAGTAKLSDFSPHTKTQTRKRSCLGLERKQTAEKENKDNNNKRTSREEKVWGSVLQLLQQVVSALPGIMVLRNFLCYYQRSSPHKSNGSGWSKDSCKDFCPAQEAAFVVSKKPLLQEKFNSVKEPRDVFRSDTFLQP